MSQPSAATHSPLVKAASSVAVALALVILALASPTPASAAAATVGAVVHASH